MIPEPPAIWRDAAGQPIACREKLRVLSENHAELAEVLKDAFEDALLMGVDEAFFRRLLAEMIEGLESPKRPGKPA